MTQPPAGPRCPRCRRALAAWRLDHCIYCGESIPAELKQGHTEPEGLKWVERPPLPTDLSKKLEMMRVVSTEPKKSRKTQMAWAIGAGVGIPVLLVFFFLAYRLLHELSPISGVLVLIVGILGGGYLLTTFLRARKT